MRKNIFIFFIAALAGSCSFLEEHNPTGLKTIYDSEDMLESSMYGIITGFVQTDSGVSGDPQEGFSNASGLLHWGSLGSSKFNDPQYECCLRCTQYSTNYRNVYFFKQLYVPITRVNTLLEALPNSPVKEEYKEEI